MSQACAACSPFSALVSDMEIFQQCTRSHAQTDFGRTVLARICLMMCAMASAEETPFRQSKVWTALVWCVPSLLGFALFLLSFPIDRQIPFWPHLSLADIFTLWFFLITPVTTVIAIIMLIKRGRSGRIALFTRALAWLAITFSVLANVLILLGMWASTY
jgi:hypothetical protein